MIEREEAGVKVCEIIFPPLKRVRQFEVIFSWHFNMYCSHTSVQAAVAKLNDLADRRESNLTSPSRNGNN